VRNVLSHIFGEAHADGESNKLIASVTKQAASQHREWLQPKAQDIPAADLRKMLSQHQRPDKPAVMINGVEYVAKLNDVMYQVSNHKKMTLPLALIEHGEVIAIMHQYAYTGKGSTIHSSGQLEWCGNDVNDCSIKIDGGRQQLTTPDGYVIPINIRHGLPYITMCPFTDKEFEELPHILWMSEDD
jgi:hypothetical protein